MFVIHKDGGITQLKAEHFAKEEDFQDLLEIYPALLSGELIDPEQPRKWVLVKREFGVPAEDEGSDIWSADHVFLDQDGILTIVEVKRQSDTRIRREVVAQMLDYAAHGIAYCKVETIRGRFESTCSEAGKNPDQELRDQFGLDIEPERFWEQVKTNLNAQKMRLLFVADVIPKELRRIVEFLNLQMKSVEVLALELKRYTGNGLDTLAPTLFGQTEAARSVKSTSPSKKWTETSFFDELSTRYGDEAAKPARRLLEWIRKNLDHPIYGVGKVDGSITGYRIVDGQKLYPLMISTQNKVYVQFGYCLKPPFDNEALRKEWLDRVNQTPGVSIPSHLVGKFPWVQLSDLEDEATMDAFLASMDWFIKELPAKTS
jgi:hypothetical protein